MDHLGIGPGRKRPARSLATGAGLLLLVLGLVVAEAAGARERVAHEARAGLADAAAAAQTWAGDARLVYVENDEDVDERGAAPRWGYLFHSPSLNRSRGYSIRDGRVVTAENLAMAFDAPPLSGEWIDSGAALRAADEGPGRAFRREHAGVVSTMLLTRGAFHDADPDQTTWTVIYAAPHAPSLFVVVDAAQGRIRRTWRG